MHERSTNIESRTVDWERESIVYDQISLINRSTFSLSFSSVRNCPLWIISLNGQTPFRVYLTRGEVWAEWKRSEINRNKRSRQNEVYEWNLMMRWGTLSFFFIFYFIVYVVNTEYTLVGWKVQIRIVRSFSMVSKDFYPVRDLKFRFFVPIVTRWHITKIPRSPDTNMTKVHSFTQFFKFWIFFLRYSYEQKW